MKYQHTFLMILFFAILISGCVGNEDATSGVDQVAQDQNSLNESNNTESLEESNLTESLGDSNTTESLNESNLTESLDEVEIEDESDNNEKIDSFELYNGSISEGDGYQINDYVLDVTVANPNTGAASFEVYNGGEKVDSFTMHADETYTFDFEGTSTIEVTLLSVNSGIFPVVKVSIIVTDYDPADISESDVIDGGHEYA